MLVVCKISFANGATPSSEYIPSLANESPTRHQIQYPIPTCAQRLMMNMRFQKLHSPTDLRRLEGHLIRLDPVARNERFDGMLSDEAVERACLAYIDAIGSNRGGIIAAIKAAMGDVTT